MTTNSLLNLGTLLNVMLKRTRVSGYDRCAMHPINAGHLRARNIVRWFLPILYTPGLADRNESVAIGQVS